MKSNNLGMASSQNRRNGLGLLVYMIANNCIRTYLLGLEEENGAMSEIEIDEMLRLCSGEHS